MRNNTIKNGADSLPSGWSLTRLGDLVSLRGGLSYKARYITASGPALVTMGCVSASEKFNVAGLKHYTGPYGKVHTLNVGDIVIATRDVTQNRVILGSPALVPSSISDDVIIAATNLYMISNRSKTSNDFIYWVLRSPAYRDHIIASAKGTTVLMLTKDAVENYTFPLPPLPEQRAVAAILGAIENKIELSRKMSATLEAIAGTVFKSWFVDFEPVRAKTEEHKQPLAHEITALFPATLETSPHGDIPAGWKMLPISEVVSLNPPTSLAGVPEAPYLDMANVPTRGHAVRSVIARRVSSGSRFQLGDTLVARITPCLENGKTAFVDFLQPGEVGWGSTEFIVIRPIEPLPKEYGYLLARSEPFRTFAINKMTGSSGRQRVPTDALSAFFVAQPTALVAKAFSSIVQPLFKRMSITSREARTLSSIRDVLLPKLISGKLRAADAERILEKLA